MIATAIVLLPRLTTDLGPVSMIPRSRTEIMDTSQLDAVLVLLPRLTTPLRAVTVIALSTVT